tara:strand:+ start:22 stop:633 length:612 start_codon:yes stop_codon:yes gene_type:complete
MIRLSLNQIKTETIKAAKGIKLEYGLADDLGNMCACLADHNINFSNDICYLLNKYSKIKYYPNIICKNKQSALVAPFIAKSLTEFIICKKNKWEGYVFSPQFLIASMSLFSQENNIQFSLKDHKNKLVAITQNSHINLYTKSFKLSYYILSLERTVNNFKSSNLTKDFVNYSIDEKEWKIITSYGKRTFVKDSTRSKEKGAGY